ncbi:MAG: hypothetical protein IIX80_06350 [Clostridia bacterium]|nr:hypothetical protein [Clostridia bacterium]
MSWEAFCESVKRVAGQAADKINQTADLATLQVKLSMAESKLKDAHAQLGLAAYRHFSEEENTAEEVASAMKEVTQCRAACDKLRAEIEEAKRKNTGADGTESAEGTETAKDKDPS